MKRIPWICLPYGMINVNFNYIEVSTIGNPWAKYLDPETGHLHDCEAYFKEMLEFLEGNLDEY